jgi:diguanylate cyclase (GGDEF)-like protein
MNSPSLRIYSKAVTLVMASAVAAYLLLGLWLARGLIAPVWPGLLLLVLGASLSSFLASGTRTRVAVRLAPAFVLAALVLLPPPSAMLVASMAALAGRGGGVAGLYRRGLLPVPPLLVAIAVAEYIVSLSGAAERPETVWGFAWILLVYVFIQGLAVGLGRLSEDADSEQLGAGVRRALGLETANVAIAWMLASLWLRDQWAHALVLSLLTIAGQYTLVTLSRALRVVRGTNLELASRVTELDTLHAIGREIVSSLEPARVFSIIERECRKIFSVDTCLLALVDRDTSSLKAVYRHRRGAEACTDEEPLHEGLSGWVVRHRRGLRIDDLRREGTDPGLRAGLGDRGIRSVLAVPLIVEGRVIGVLSVRSRDTSAYDDHQLSVLTTIAQQAAVAIENARHYQMATVDSLTGFFLRDYFFRRLNEEYKRATRYGGAFSLLMLDLDGFKAINDRHGHMVGDRFLHDVSGTIRGELRAADLPCRYGGDEFCLLLPETELEGARAIAERIRSAIADHSVAADGLALRTTASIGVAAFPEHDAGDVSGLLQNADEALYRAKRAGRDRVVPAA